MDSSVVAVAVLGVTVLLRIALILLVIWLLVPRRRSCPQCGEASARVVASRVLRLLLLERRWCLRCGWDGIAKCPPGGERSARRSTAPTAHLLFLVALPWLGCDRGDDVRRLFDDPSAWVDLTYAFDAQTIYWPTADGFSLEVVAAGMTPQGYYYAANNIRTSEHGGTHLDAPLHFAEGRHATDQIPLAQLVGPAVVVDVTGKTAADRDYRITAADLQAFETAHGRIPDGAIVLFRTGWGAKWPDRAAYLGTAGRGAAAVAELRFPGIDTTAARWLVRERRIDAVGIDTPSIDYGQSSTFDTHRILYAVDIPAFENVANLDRMPETGGYVVALPMKIAGGSGGPLRIVGVVPPPR